MELLEQIEDLKDQILQMYKDNNFKMTPEMDPLQDKLEKLEELRQSSYVGF